MNFTRPKRLFAAQDGGDLAPIYFTGADSDISLIDVIIRKFNDKYYAIIKDERWEDKAPKTHKSIRIASSDNLLGPYSNPGPSLSPNWREAPIIIRTPEGKFRLYYENYGEHGRMRLASILRRTAATAASSMSMRKLTGTSKKAISSKSNHLSS